MNRKEFLYFLQGYLGCLKTNNKIPYEKLTQLATIIEEFKKHLEKNNAEAIMPIILTSQIEDEFFDEKLQGNDFLNENYGEIKKNFNNDFFLRWNDDLDYDQQGDIW